MIETAPPLQVGDQVELVTLPPGYSKRVLRVGLVGEVEVTGLEFGWCSIRFQGHPHRLFVIAQRHLRRIEDGV